MPLTQMPQIVVCTELWRQPPPPQHGHWR